MTAGVLLHGGPIVAHAGEPRTGQQERAARLVARHMLSRRGPGYASFLTAVLMWWNRVIRHRARRG